MAALLVLLDMLLPLQPNPLGAPQERTERLAPKARAHCKAHRRSMAIVRRPELPLVGGAVMVLLRRLLLLLPRLVVLPRDHLPHTTTHLIFHSTFVSPLNSI